MLLFSSIKSCIQKISLVREALRVSLPLFWTRPSTKNFYKITQNSSFSVASPEHTNYNLLGRHVVDRPYNRRNVNGQRNSNLPSSTTRVCNVLELKPVKLALLTFSKQKSVKAVHFQIDSTTTLIYLVKVGGTGNQMLLKLSKEIWQYLLKHQIKISLSSLSVEADWQSRNSRDPSE